MASSVSGEHEPNRALWDWYRPEILSVQTELSEVHTKKTKGRYSPWPVPFRASLVNKRFITRRSYSKIFKSGRAGSFETLYIPILRDYWIDNGAIWLVDFLTLWAELNRVITLDISWLSWNFWNCECSKIILREITLGLGVYEGLTLTLHSLLITTEYIL